MSPEDADVEFVSSPEVYDVRAYGATPEMHETVTDVLQERKDQDFRWGEQNHPMTLGVGWQDDYESQADTWKSENTLRVQIANRDGVPSDRNAAWDGILLEEVYELLSEGDPDKQYTEAIQVAAVALNIAQGIRRRQRG